MMGHYDDAYDSHYAEMRTESRRRASIAIPAVIKSLDDAQRLLAQNANDIEHSTRIIGDIKFMAAALRSQDGNP